MVVGRLLSFWNGSFLGDMLIFLGSIILKEVQREDVKTTNTALCTEILLIVAISTRLYLQIAAGTYINNHLENLYIPGTWLSSILVVEASKTRSFPIKTRVIWVPGIWNYELGFPWNYELGLWNLNTMRFGGDWTPQSLSGNMTGCLGFSIWKTWALGIGCIDLKCNFWEGESWTSSSRLYYLWPWDGGVHVEHDISPAQRLSWFKNGKSFHWNPWIFLLLLGVRFTQAVWK